MVYDSTEIYKIDVLSSIIWKSANFPYKISWKETDQFALDILNSRKNLSVHPGIWKIMHRRAILYTRILKKRTDEFLATFTSASSTNFQRIIWRTVFKVQGMDRCKLMEMSRYLKLLKKVDSEMYGTKGQAGNCDGFTLYITRTSRGWSRFLAYFKTSQFKFDSYTLYNLSKHFLKDDKITSRRMKCSITGRVVTWKKKLVLDCSKTWIYHCVTR